MPGQAGNSGGKKGRSGRKSKAAELGLQKLLGECWTDSQRRNCIRKLASDANSKDFRTRHASRELLLAYAFGKPKIQAEVQQFEFSPDDLDILNDYELECFLSGSDLRALLATARRRIAKEKASAATAEE